MEKNYSDCSYRRGEAEDAARFYEFLKSAGSTALEDNSKSTVGNEENAPYPEVQTQARGERDERSGTAQHHSSAVWDGFRASRERFLRRMFNSYEPSADNAVQVLSQNFKNFESGDHESSKPFTRDHSKRTPVVPESLLDQMNRVVAQ